MASKTWVWLPIVFSCVLVCDSRHTLELLFTTNTDEMSNVPVQVNGTIPSWLRGLFIRNGPGRFEMGQRNFTHAFDGFAKLHSFEFVSNTSCFFFSTKFLRTNFYQDSLEEQTVAPYILFDRVQPPFNREEYLTSLYNGIDNTNINVMQLNAGNGRRGEALVALSDFWQFYEFKSDLSTIKRHDASLPLSGMFGKVLPVPSSAHPVREFGTNNFISFYSLMNPIPGLAGSVNLIRVKSLAERELITSIPMQSIPYMHSFGLTERYAILFAHPIYINVYKMLKTRSPLKSLEWESGKNTDVFVVNILTGRRLHLSCSAMFFMHVANSYQHGNQLIVDVSAYTSLKFIESINFKVIRSDNPSLSPSDFANMKRVQIDLRSGEVIISEFLYQPGMSIANKFDLPTINPLYSQKRYCYIYGLGSGANNGSLSPTYIVKKDICDQGMKDRVWIKNDHYPTEPWFELRPGGHGEDDGVVISLVMDMQRQTSFLLFLNGKTLREISRAELPTWVPFTIHGRMFHSVGHHSVYSPLNNQNPYKVNH